MRIWVIAIILFIACGKKKEQQSLVTNDLTFFMRYAPECERFLESGKKCAGQNCLNAAALEIVGVDTANTDTHKVYAWCWMQQFRMLDSIPAAGKGMFTPALFKVMVSGRSYTVTEYFLPNPEESLRDQLEREAFPNVLIRNYFVNQRKETELERVRVLADKAKDKYKMYLEKAYLPQPESGN